MNISYGIIFTLLILKGSAVNQDEDYYPYSDNNDGTSLLVVDAYIEG